jgi:DNA processing protein
MEKYWLAFASIEKIGSVFVQTLFNHFGSIKSAWCAGPDDLYRIENITKKQMDDFLRERSKTDPDRCLEYVENKKLKYVNFTDEDYPELLKQISNPPMTLFYKGDLKRCNFNRTLSVVGSRKASESAKTVLSGIISEFKGTDICVVSGLAFGIDSCAHKSAIANNIPTIGVIASGFDFVYPTSNKALYKKIEDECGVIFSEYWSSFPPLTWRFPHRNRIVTGLSKGTLVAEAALKSGAIISANLCLEQNRELMCMPGLLTNPNTEGIYKLIKNGAAVVTKADDILEALDWTIETAPKTTCFDDMTEDERKVFDMIAIESCSFDKIASELNMDVAELMVVLTTLELSGKIKQISGEKYIAAVKI